MSVPIHLLNDGNGVPLLGLGTWNSPPGEVTAAVSHAIDVGYRHIDCAHIYQNEHEVGAAVASKISEGSIKREDLFITSKLWNTFHRPDLVRSACETSLRDLGLDYLNLYLIHWPMAYKEDGELFPSDPSGKVQYSTVDYVDTWKEMEKLVDDGLVKSIGLSNFNSKQIDRVLAVARIKPTMNQIECHPYLTQKPLIDFCKEKGIAVTAYSPLGSPNRPWANPGDPVLLEDPQILKLAEKYKKTPAQVLIRYQLQRDIIVIPKSTNKSRIESNFKVLDFTLSPEDMSVIDSFDRNGRFIALDNVADHPHHPFANDEF